MSQHTISSALVSWRDLTNSEVLLESSSTFQSSINNFYSMQGGLHGEGLPSMQ